MDDVGYDGPLGTLSKTERYRFRLIAVDQALDLERGRDEDIVATASSEHVLDEGSLSVVHERPA